MDGVILIALLVCLNEKNNATLYDGSKFWTSLTKPRQHLPIN